MFQLIFSGRTDLHYNILSKSLVLPILEAGSQPHLLCEEHLSLPVLARSCISIDCTEFLPAELECSLKSSKRDRHEMVDMCKPSNIHWLIHAKQVTTSCCPSVKHECHATNSSDCECQFLSKPSLAFDHKTSYIEIWVHHLYFALENG